MTQRTTRLFALAFALLLVLTACRREGEEKASSSPGATASSLEPAGGTPSPTAPGAGGQAGASPSPQQPNPSPLAAAAVRPIQAGNYIYDETGMRKFGGCGPDGPPPTPTSLRVDPANGARQRTVRERTTNQGGDIVTTDFEYRTDGIYLVYVHTERRTPLGSESNEFEPDPPRFVYPAKPSAGQSWSYSMTSKNGNSKADVKITIEAVDDTAAGGDGKQVKAVRVLRETHATGSSQFGDFDINEKTTTWFGTETRLMVRDVTDANGTAGACAIEIHTESVIRSTTPS